MHVGGNTLLLFLLADPVAVSNVLTLLRFFSSARLLLTVRHLLACYLESRSVVTC